MGECKVTEMKLETKWLIAGLLPTWERARLLGKRASKCFNMFLFLQDANQLIQITLYIPYLYDMLHQTRSLNVFEGFSIATHCRRPSRDGTVRP